MNKKIIIIFIVIIAVFVLGIKVFAIDTTFKLQIKESKNLINYGDEVSFTISIAELQKGEAIGTNAITARIEYDSNVLEYESYVTNNNWTMASFNENNKTFAITNSEYVTENEDIITLKFKARANISATNTTVSLKNISAGFRMSKEDITRTSTIKAADVSKTIELSQKQGGNENSNNISIENPISNSQNNNTVSKTSINSDTSTAGRTLPATGVKNIILIIACIVVVVLGSIAIAIYNKYQK